MVNNGTEQDGEGFSLFKKTCCNFWTITIDLKSIKDCSYASNISSIYNLASNMVANHAIGGN